VLPIAPHMDIFWANAAVFSLPSSQRVEVLVHDGASDLRLWPGPGPDRVLSDAYGPGLREALDAQRTKAGGEIPLGEAVRLHPGKLHSNYLLWVSSRGPERDAQQAQAPDLKAIEDIVIRCLEFAASNNSVSVAFGPLGEGPGARPAEERLAAIVRAAHRYQENCYASGKPARVELVRVCDPRSGVTAAARRMVGRLAQTAPEPTPTRFDPEPERPSKKTMSLGRPRATSTGASAGGRRKAADVLDATEVAHRRVTSGPYDRSKRYREAEWFVHSRFGVGQVRKVTPDGAIEVLFEDGSTKKMLHAQSG
jgi:O-acetyl-ADP-ribose deacetylase (regulator of RNase III)